MLGSATMCLPISLAAVLVRAVFMLQRLRDLPVRLAHRICRQVGQSHPAPRAGAALQPAGAPAALEHVQGQLEVRKAVQQGLYLFTNAYRQAPIVAQGAPQAVGERATRRALDSRECPQAAQ